MRSILFCLFGYFCFFAPSCGWKFLRFSYFSSTKQEIDKNHKAFQNRFSARIDNSFDPGSIDDLIFKPKILAFGCIFGRYIDVSLSIKFLVRAQTASLSCCFTFGIFIFTGLQPNYSFSAKINQIFSPLSGALSPHRLFMIIISSF